MKIGLERMLEAADRGSPEPMSESDSPKSEGFRNRPETSLPGDNSYEVADLRVEIGRGRVVRQDRVLPLTKLSFDLLVALIQAAPNVLTPDQMMERVWPGVVISPETVTQRVKVLRDALGDSPRNPRYIEGIRGRGYRLLPTPTLLTQPSPTQPGGLSSFGPESALPSAPSVWRRLWLALAIGTIAAACVLVYWLQPVRSDRNVTIERKAVTVSAAPIESIAVLPFENLSTAPNGGIIALGMSEAILHHLGSVHRLTVIARTSSFAFQGVHADSRDIARTLNVHYLLEGSVQTDQLRLRVTAQLVDATTGANVWSIRLDRNPQDIFAVQDEIARAVAEALQLSLRDREAAASGRHGTQQIGAWLAFQQGRALVATRRISDLQSARQHFTEAIRIDPNFAGAYVGLAEAYIAASFVPQSEFWLSTQPQLSPADQTEVARLLGRALELDPDNGDAYLMRAWQEKDAGKAEADYRRGLGLSPNNANGHAHLARLLFLVPGKGTDYFDPAKREEALKLVDRASELDPMAPGPYLIKALMLSYGRSDWKQAIALSLQALGRDPNFYPALMKLAEFKWAGSGELAEAAKYAEQALALEPSAGWPRHLLSRIYLDLRDFAAARNVIEEQHVPDPDGEIPLEMYKGNWPRVSTLVRQASFAIPGDFEMFEIGAIRAALEAHEFTDSRNWIDAAVGLNWSTDGKPVFTVSTTSKEAPVLMGRLLIASGDTEHGRSVLRAALHEMDHEAFDLGRGDNWFGSSRAEALAILGDYEGAVEALRRACAAAFMYDMWYRLEAEPAYAPFRNDPRYRALVEKEHNRIDHERALLVDMRAQKLIPMRPRRKSESAVGIDGSNRIGSP